MIYLREGCLGNRYFDEERKMVKGRSSVYGLPEGHEETRHRGGSCPRNACPTYLSSVTVMVTWGGLCPCQREPDLRSAFGGILI